MESPTCDKDLSSVVSLEMDIVDATQMIDEDTILERVEEPSQLNIHKDVQKDMVFLQKSWANVEELEGIESSSHISQSGL